MMGNDRIAEVIVDIRSRQLDRTFDYLVPAEFEHEQLVGVRVMVSFGKQTCAGFVVGVHELESGADNKLKPLLSVIDDEPLLTADLMKLTDWLCYRYACTRLQALTAIMPNVFRMQKIQRYQLTTNLYPKEWHEGVDRFMDALWTWLHDSGAQTETQIVKKFGVRGKEVLQALVHAGIVQRTTKTEERMSMKLQFVLLPAVSLEVLEVQAVKREKRATRQAAILRELVLHQECVLSMFGLQPSHPAVRALIEEGFVQLITRQTYRTPGSGITEAKGEMPLTLTGWQERALQRILNSLSAEGQEALVLHGVTGSGKTEIYLQAIASVIEAGGTALVLVPEIALTPQLAGRFKNRFGEQIAILHSGLSTGERYDEWLRIRRGQVRIVIGARSAIFAPLKNLKLLILDEEHESSYKQEETPRYDARQVALERSRQFGATVVFGSATPSLQTMHMVRTGRAQMITLPVRANQKPLPPVEIVDMREEMRMGNHSLFSRALSTRLQDVIDNGHQAILFLNRRGFASSMLCRNCGSGIQCPRCDISLTVHRLASQSILVCHYCDFRMPAPASCPDCGESAMRPFGVGTQQIEMFLKEQWPDWRVLRMDVDTTRQKGAHQRFIQAFLDHQADVLIGTQMIAKGLDFPKVALVGVIAAETMLAIPDYRSVERTFQLLTQVAGRSGRAEVDGHTVVQTYRPEHFSIQTAAAHDFHAFYREEEVQRQRFGYPPFCELTVLTAIHAEERLAKGCAQRFEREVKRTCPKDGVTVLPAVASGVARIEDKFRYQVVVKYLQWDEVRQSIVQAFELVHEKMRHLDGTCILDVSAGRIG